MRKHLSLLALVLVATAQVLAQSPPGWRVRLDRSTSASDPDAAGAVRFVAAGPGFHATNPTAAVFWNPMQSATGTYSVKGTFTLIKPSSHVNYYGLVFAGSNLEAADQAYTYFMVAQDGTWLVKRRGGSATQDLSDRTPDEAVKKPDAEGKSTNTLEVRVGKEAVEFVVNGKVVDTKPRTGRLATTDGIYGIRVNHLLEVQVDGFGVSKP